MDELYLDNIDEFVNDHDKIVSANDIYVITLMDSLAAVLCCENGVFNFYFITMQCVRIAWHRGQPYRICLGHLVNSAPDYFLKFLWNYFKNMKITSL